MDGFGFQKVAAAIPQVKVADCGFNGKQLLSLAEQATQRGVEIVLFPELAITGATCGDLFLQRTLLEAADAALEQLVHATRKLPLTLIVGAPLRHGGRLYNCAVVFSQGRVMGVVPKRYLPEEQNRWFASGAGCSEEQIWVAGMEADFGTDLSFAVNGVEFGVEIGEELQAVIPPSSEMALNGAKIIFNPASFSEGVGSEASLCRAVCAQSARCEAGYVMASAGYGESTTDAAYAGTALIAEQGTLLSKGERFSLQAQLVVSDIDIEALERERLSNTLFRINPSEGESNLIEMEVPEALRGSALDRQIDPSPFVPHDEEERRARCEEIFQIQALGLAKRLQHTACKCAVVGISGGLDSTLALLVTVRAFDRLELDRKGIVGITMPGYGTTERTYRNALSLMEALGITQQEISIRKACEQHFADIGLAADDRSVTYENSQARERTQILMDVANKLGGMVIGTGDLSELARGWATYNGDQMSMYGVNAGVPKTLVRHLVRWVAEQESDATTRNTLLDIVATPVSPELLPADEQGNIAQKTEDLVGPYDLHDFYLYHFVRRGASPAKILFLAEEAFGEQYPREVMLKWLKVFFRRLFSQQFKRSAMPDGARVGSVSLSPRGGWQMPSDAAVAVWLEELEEL